MHHLVWWSPRAVTYGVSTQTKTGLLLKEPAAMIIWLAKNRMSDVTHLTTHNKMWRRNGFGVFLICLIVKRLAAQAAPAADGRLPQSTIWLQSQPSEESANQFYESLGFVKVNDDIMKDDGKSFMPSSLSKKTCNTTFIELKKGAMNLLVLRVDGNTSYKETTTMNSPSKTIIGPEEEITQPNSKLAMNSKEVETWVIDDYIALPKLHWGRLPNIMEWKLVKNRRD